MTELPGADAALAATPGATLAAARQAHGLSVADVAEQMRISPRQVDAIESGRYGELPGAVFVRGFIRNYARLLKLDPVPLLHALEPELSGEVPLRAHEIAGTLPETTRRHRPSWWLGAAAAVIAIAAVLAGYEWWRAQSGAARPAQRDTLLDTPATPAAPAVPSTQAPIALTPEPLSDIPAGGGGSTAAQSSAAAPAAEPAPAAVEPASAPGEGRIEIRFLQESWVELRDGAGNVQFSATGAAGSTRSFDVRPPVRVVVGNASGVSITYNGKPFDVDAHAARNIARFTLE
jgi:cytoskeleton protein RodZ